MLRADDVFPRLLQLPRAADVRLYLRRVDAVRIRPAVTVQVGAGRVLERVFHDIPVHAGESALYPPLVDIQVVRQKLKLALLRAEDLAHRARVDVQRAQQALVQPAHLSKQHRFVVRHVIAQIPEQPCLRLPLHARERTAAQVHDDILRLAVRHGIHKVFDSVHIRFLLRRTARA